MEETELSDRVEPHPRLSGSEKETAITMYGDGEQYTIYSAKPTIVKSLLKHDHFEMNWTQVLVDDRPTRVEEWDELQETTGDIVAIEGELPVGTLTVKSKPRVRNIQSGIVSTETVDSSVFASDEE